MTIQGLQTREKCGLAGLCHGLERETLLLELLQEEIAHPLDYRAKITGVRNPGEIAELVSEFAASAHIASQSIKSRPRKISRSALQGLALGSSAAENEFRTLGQYFVETAEYLRTLRGEVSVVAGRKGSGKSAIFFQVRDHLREKKRQIVVDLKPESHQLSLFREEISKIADVGFFDHTLAAFWYFLILTEIAITIRKGESRKLKFDNKAYAAARELSELLDRFDISESGDFTTRINRLVSSIVQEIGRLRKNGQSITAQIITNIIFKGSANELRDAIVKRSESVGQISLLFDNIDKGWPATGIDELDVRLVRLLIESLSKLKRDFASAGRELVSVVFLRNDIYELMVGQTPDRGKSGQVLIDWTDRAKLRQLICERLRASTREYGSTFEALWTRYVCEQVGERSSFEYLVDHSLMRPRFLLNIIEGAIANAINRGRSKVEEQDCLDAVRQHSLYLISDFGYELRDVSGLPEDILYGFVGVTEILTYEEILSCLKKARVLPEKFELAQRLLLWYGVLGIATKDGDQRFIYDYDYNFRRLEAEMTLVGGDHLYIVNQALHVALKY